MGNIIKIRLGDIKSHFLGYSIEYLLGDKNFSNKKIIKECLFILLFGLVGILFTILLHKRCFHFFNKHIKSDYIDPVTYKTLGNGIISRLLLIIISLLITINTFILILYKIIENINIDYDWGGLHQNLKDNGYDPYKFKNYIKVEKYKGKYRCSDGNHRHRILLDIYGPDKIIDVEYKGISYDTY
jgi:hypothetical protein